MAARFRTPLLERELDMVPNATFKVLLFGG
jgi:hypothetical protein